MIFDSQEYAYKPAFDLVSNTENIVVFTGGQDIHPDLYGTTPDKNGFDKLARLFESPDIPEVDKESIRLWSHFGLDPRYLKVGICRGSQFLFCMHGGSLFPHVDNHGRFHSISIDSKYYKRYNITPFISVTSTHHQMWDYRSLPEGIENDLIGYCFGIAKGNGVDNKTVNPEVLYFPLTNTLLFQYHPEYMPKNSEGYTLFTHLVNEKVELSNDIQYSLTI